MPLISGCGGSRVFQAFWQHILHELQVPSFHYLMEEKKENREIRVTIIVRNTRYKRILNLEKLLKSLQNNNIVVRATNFNYGMSFKEQLEVTSNTAILITMRWLFYKTYTTVCLPRGSTCNYSACASCCSEGIHPDNDCLSFRLWHKPNKCILLQQSHNPFHGQLSYFLSTLKTMKKL